MLKEFMLPLRAAKRWVGKNLAKVALATALGGGLVIGASEVLELTATSTAHDAAQDQAEYRSDQVFLRRAMSDPRFVAITGIQPVAHTKSLTEKAQQNNHASDVTRLLGLALISTSVAAGGAARKRQRLFDIHSEASTKLLLTLKALRRQYEPAKPQAPSLANLLHTIGSDEAMHTLRTSVADMGDSIEKGLSELHNFTASYTQHSEQTVDEALQKLTATQQQREQERLDMAERIRLIREESATHQAKITSDFTPIYAGFAALREQYAMPAFVPQPQLALAA